MIYFKNIVLLSFLLLFFLFGIIQCTHFNIGPYEKDCIQLKAEKNNMIVGSYEFMDRKASCIISIFNRSDKKKEPVFKSTKIQDKFEIQVPAAAVYSFCYDNRKNSDVTIMFTLRVKESHNVNDSELSTIDDVKQINEKTSELFDQFLEVFDEQERMMEKSDLYKQFNEKMNSKLILWLEIQIILLVVLTLVHIYYIKSFFEIKTIV
ncbi:hypothetical protein PFAG_04388 [Plasmodium falciparum Santa Lucia]|uniref:GOLD domain-containing protein n=10 Tax=Plasmodium falciparum TaxID=5833 RepID=A0A024VXK2_PLAFA|nr:hypothetical protein PFFVO_03986 [Plasmodium falciparum Vietnam Oak-Knoll (FVO)]ETW33187.1 hypothetical protein PFTANZ_06094 [Plasmodium falciparum Tanzania (2000708)]ETW40911.1 hypothetical protein PFNF135_04551 [Plasmodium falciparum NF135/5.C10]ETW47703.1 hypothetical protein PFMALIP_04238 [Plasmodium falciparum MaliPS096_E11]EUR66838.1 hypothetical protein PFBG_04418 [Plasmodium falciparum 7G8]EUT81169.1 hypothetical protein PFAG_04388 [Plasmodium falciparum Santa Lucia]EWC74857.1 hypo